MSEQERQKIRKLLELGEYAHMLARTGQLSNPEMQAMSQQITELDKTVNAALGKKPPSREDGTCPQCGIPVAGNFCGGCGANIDEFFSKPILACGVCGMQVAGDDVFCGVCGVKRGA